MKDVRLQLLALYDSGGKVPAPLDMEAHEFTIGAGEAFDDLEGGLSPLDQGRLADDGHRCIVQRHAGKFVGVTWVTMGDSARLAQAWHCALRQDMAFSFNHHTIFGYNQIDARYARDRALLLEGRKRGISSVLTSTAWSGTSVRDLQYYGYEVVGCLTVLHRAGRVHVDHSMREDVWRFEQPT